MKTPKECLPSLEDLKVYKFPDTEQMGPMSDATHILDLIYKLQAGMKMVDLPEWYFDLFVSLLIFPTAINRLRGISNHEQRLILLNGLKKSFNMAYDMAVQISATTTILDQCDESK